jgi:Fe-S cluster assembly protein SufD
VARVGLGRGARVTVMTAVAERHERLLAPQAALAGQSAPAWLAALRQAGRERFAAVGVPTTRDENFRFTPLGPVAETAFVLAAGEVAPPASLIDAARLPGSAATLVVVDGIFQPGLSNAAGLPAGAVATGLEAALTSGEGPLQRILAALAVEEHPFAALNSAYLRDGAFIALPSDAVVEGPIQVIVAASGGAAPTMAHPRIVLEAGRHSQATVVLTFVGPEGATYLTNVVTQAALGEGATLDLVTEQRESLAACHLHHLHAHTAKAATLHSRAFTLGGRLVRNDLGAVLGGEGAHVTIDGVYLADEQQLVDNHTSIDHATAHCTSHELYKGILDDQARAVFNGRIIVRLDAQKTDAKQTNRALLLSDEATINSNPQLEIFADDVKCTHGAAVGQLDEDQMFYLQARGLTAKAARDLLLHAFAGEVLDGVAVPALRARIEARLFERLARDLAKHGL